MTWDILGKSSRGERPTQQGDGTTAQEKYRTAFQQCTFLWNSLPEACPVVEPDPPTSSKESVWAAKLEHGVVCSYYDLFLRCCIKFALANDGAMPDGDCFPCVSDCDCTDISIGYTTQGMQVNEEQTLTVEGAEEGCDYNWAITGGGGSLSGESGVSVIYTAPDENPSCELNPTIELWCGGAMMANLAIGINSYGAGSTAYEVKWITGYSGGDCVYSPYSKPPCDYWCGPVTYFMVAQYDCEGTELRRCAGTPQFCWYTNPVEDVPAIRGTCWDGFTVMGQNQSLGVTDMRSEVKIAKGCCPAGLL